MQIISQAQTRANRQAIKSAAKYPDISDPRCQDGMLFPTVRPGFTMSKGQKVFTIGSCFARNIERKLTDYMMPTLAYSPPEADPIKVRQNTVLNEYNPGTIAQRILRAVSGEDDNDTGILPEDDGFSDFFITGQNPSPIDLIRERRKAIRAVYADLPTCDHLILTLGMTEAWYDRASGQYLNRAPGATSMKTSAPDSAFELHVLELEDCVALLAPAIKAARGAGVKNILLTVSPVPLQRSFSDMDAVIANNASKSTLRTAAHILTQTIDGVDYFPSYEMVTLLAGNPFKEDNVHVKDEVVARVTDYMLRTYEKA
jgi:GSCFA family